MSSVPQVKASFDAVQAQVRGAMEIALFIQNIQEERAEVEMDTIKKCHFYFLKVALYIFTNQSDNNMTAVKYNENRSGLETSCFCGSHTGVIGILAPYLAWKHFLVHFYTIYVGVIQTYKTFEIHFWKLGSILENLLENEDFLKLFGFWINILGKITRWDQCWGKKNVWVHFVAQLKVFDTFKTNLIN